jgi:hypothetical protein
MTMAHEFTAWPKTSRLFRDITVSEKIDGTNAAVHISAFGDGITWPDEAWTCVVGGIRYVISAQSHKRIVTPEADNYGFARWVYDNAADLVRTLGPGLHFGEWWGRGIQRAYGLAERRFSLFNTHTHADLFAVVGEVFMSSVPVLYQGPFREMNIGLALRGLELRGSVAAPGFANPEGICVYHSRSKTVFKVTLDNQDAGKWEA